MNSESTPPTVTKWTRQLRCRLLRRKQAHLNITNHFPMPLPSEYKYDFVEQQTSAGWRCSRISEAGRFSGVQIEPRHGGERDCTPGAELPDLCGAPPPELPRRSCRTGSQSGPQRVKAKVPFPQFFSTMPEITPTTSLYLLWKYQRRQTQSLWFIMSSGGAHSFWPWY
jgi:hypothetical protein